MRWVDYGIKAYEGYALRALFYLLAGGLIAVYQDYGYIPGFHVRLAFTYNYIII